MLNAELVPRGAAVILLLVVSSLLYWDISSGNPRTDSMSTERTVLEAIDTTVDSLLVSYRIDQKTEKKWAIRSKGGETIRIERRVLVPADLVSVRFNRDLGVSVRKHGGHVIGTERTRESVVVLHVIVGTMTVHTISLELLPAEKS